MLEQSILAWLAIGLVIGLASRLLRRQRDPGGLIVGVLIGIAGALLAGYVAQAAVSSCGAGSWRSQRRAPCCCC
jgi:uncharacterized membrane protein YeaQ/YmgE (transglycosylase-associated protein family)